MSPCRSEKVSTRSGRTARILFDVAAGEGEDLGFFLARLGRPHGIAADAGDAVLLAEGVEHLDGFGGQADDALRQAGHGCYPYFGRRLRATSS
jgi:hypothetical protein